MGDEAPSPLSEPAAEPAGLDHFYDAAPEDWSPQTLAAAVAAQREERNKRAAAAARKVKKA